MVRLILLLFMQCRLLLILSAVVCSKTRNHGMQLKSGLVHPAAPAVGYFYGYADFSIQEFLDDDSYIAKNKSAISTVSFSGNSVARSANRRLDFVKERLIYDKSPNNLRGVAAVPRNAEGRTEQVVKIPSTEPRFQRKQLRLRKSAYKPMTCITSFRPTCKINLYVRFWNRRFFPEDCYESPLRPAMKEKTPWDKQKYVVFEPDWGGWNNIRMAAETVMIFAHATGRTLVMPPTMKFYLLDLNAAPEDNFSTFGDYFDLRKLRESITIITSLEFIEHVAKPGMLKIPYPTDIDMTSRRLFEYWEKACYSRKWNPGKYFIGFNLSQNNPEVFGEFRQDARKQQCYRYMARNPSRQMMEYDQELHKERALYFYGRPEENRLLTHFYRYLYWDDFHTEQIYKRLARDRLRYKDEIFCAAGKIVALLHRDSNVLDGKGVQLKSNHSPLSMGGNTNENSTYFAMHVRRGDFQYDQMRLSSEELYEQTKHFFNSSISKIIYISTDEYNHSYFAPFMRPPFVVKFLVEYQNRLGWFREEEVELDEFRSNFSYKFNTSKVEHLKVDRNHLGMIEQVVCANAHTFIGTALSTFTGYITRMRGK
jgi:hypothetical protein